MAPARDRRELVALFNEQLDFLRTSAQAFDAGVLHEYKRIALVLRVLLHDTNASHSLLKQLGVKATLQYWDTRDRPVAAPDRQIVAVHDWPQGMVGMAGTTSVFPDPHGEGAWRWFPMLGSDPGLSVRRRDFEAWWRDSIIELKSGQTFTRRDFVLGIANREGGAHVDPQPPVSWVLLRDQSWDDAAGMVDAWGRRLPVPRLVPAVVRQIGYEAAETFAEQRSTLS
jgi:hypothetical protein